MLVAFFREAPWLTRRRLRDYASLFVGIYCLAFAWALSGHGIRDPLGNLKGTDFVSFWTVSAALQEHEARAIYRPLQLAELEERTTAAHGDFFAWAYPPIMMLVIYPLALLPYLWSLIAWLAVTLALYLRTLWRIIPDPLVLWVGVGFPAVFVTFTHGQNGLLIAGLLGLALSLLPHRQRMAGVLIGALVMKPHLGILIPVALVFGGYWRAAAIAALTAVVLCGASALLFGSEVWLDFLASMPFARAMLEQGLVPYFKFQSVFAAIRLLGGSLAAAYASQALATTIAAALTAWIWRQPVEQRLKNAVLATATPFATPFVFDYDLTLLALAMAWLVALQTRTKALPWEKTVLAATFLAPFVARPLANLSGVIVTPLIEAALLAVLFIRCRTPAGEEFGSNQ